MITDVVSCPNFKSIFLGMYPMAATLRQATPMAAIYGQMPKNAQPPAMKNGSLRSW
jgi:hypothetical protein